MRNTFSTLEMYSLYISVYEVYFGLTKFICSVDHFLTGHSCFKEDLKATLQREH